jgi:DUF4097 and DUF4098 domain-containing protein YvlB
MPFRHRLPSRPGLASFAVAALALLLSLPAAAAEVTRPLRAALSPAAGATLELENLAGTVRVEPSAGAELVIEGTVHAESAALADLLRLELAPSGDRLVAKLTYPLDEHRRYVYPRQGGGGFLSGLSQSNGKFQGREVTVYSGTRSGAVLLYCDLTVKLPAGHGAKLRNLAGAITAERVQGDLRLDTGSGDVTARDNAGALAADTGSGDVTVERHRGALAVDTGSGDVTVADVEGAVTVDTGSGSITGRDVRGTAVACDTGSGDVRLERVAAALALDTGSGSIVGHGLEAGDKVVADTGSGDVRLAGDFSRVRELRADTGSGDVILEPTGAFPALRVEVSTGSGAIAVDVAGLTVERSKRGDFRGRVSDGAAGVVRIGTGSGDVVLRTAAR